MMVLKRLRRYFGGEDPEAVPEVIDRAEGADRDVAVVLVDLPVQRRPSGDVVLRDVDATVAMLNAADEQLPYAGKGRKGWRCAACEAPLEEAQASPQSDTLQVRPSKGPGFSMEVTMPGWRCGSCGRVQLAADEERMDAFREAVMAAMAAGGVRRS